MLITLSWQFINFSWDSVSDNNLLFDCVGYIELLRIHGYRFNSHSVNCILDWGDRCIPIKSIYLTIFSTNIKEYLVEESDYMVVGQLSLAET